MLSVFARLRRGPATGAWTALLLPALLVASSVHRLWADDPTPSAPIRLGIIGLDTSHAIAFTELINGAQPGDPLARCRVVAAYPPGSPDIESSVVRVPQYTERIRQLGVEIVDSIDQIMTRVDGVLLETNDGRPHLQQLRPVLAAKKPVFVDKPVAGSLRDAIQIFAAAEAAGVPLFSSSSLRFSPATQQVRQGAIGQVVGCDAYSPCSLEATHPDLYWYGVHGVETLFTVMGPGCERVARMSSEGTDVVVGQWTDGRIGTFRGVRQGKGGYGATAFGSQETRTIDKYDGYGPLVVEIVRFFETGKPPVDARETLEIYAFMTAADVSKQRGGVPVTLAEVMQAAHSTTTEDTKNTEQ
jgi:hypothetical protein